MAAPATHSQPSTQQAYETSGNPVSKNPTEEQSSISHKASSETAEKRFPHDQSTPPSNSSSATSGSEKHTDFNDAGGMAPATEGKVRDAVVGNRTGASGSEPDLASDLDKKKAEQAAARESAQASRDKNADVGGILGQRGGPATAPQFE